MKCRSPLLAEASQESNRFQGLMRSQWSWHHDQNYDWGENEWVFNVMKCQQINARFGVAKSAFLSLTIAGSSANENMQTVVQQVQGGPSVYTFVNNQVTTTVLVHLPFSPPSSNNIFRTTPATQHLATSSATCASQFTNPKIWMWAFSKVRSDKGGLLPASFTLSTHDHL